MSVLYTICPLNLFNLYLEILKIEPLELSTEFSTLDPLLRWFSLPKIGFESNFVLQKRISLSEPMNQIPNEMNE